MQTVFKTVIAVLTLRITREQVLQFNYKHFLTGLIGTWIAGIGRYWDDPGASLVQHAGLGSVIYIFLLAAFIWIIVKPFLVEGWSYFRLLTFISLTSFPAIFYAIPVERFYSLETANTINVWFLAVVAAWRMAMYFHFLNVFTRLSFDTIVTVTLLPVCLIITALTILNLHRVVFDLMGGRTNTSPHDGAYTVLYVLTFLSAMLAPVLLLIYLARVFIRIREYRKRGAG